MVTRSSSSILFAATAAVLALAGAAVASNEESEGSALVAEATSQPADDAAEDSADSGTSQEESTEATDVVVVYQPPRRGAPRVNVGAGGVRGAFAPPRPLVLAPDHVGLTTSATPSLFWHIDGAPGDDLSVVFTLNDDTSIEPRVEVKLETPEAAGIQRVRLDALDVKLAPDIDYEWSIALVGDDELQPQLAVSVGYVRRVAPPAELSGAKPDAAAYARASLWYDALAALADAIEKSPGDTKLREQRSSLLRQAKLEAAVE
jgi:hypothetical protein